MDLQKPADISLQPDTHRMLDEVMDEYDRFEQLGEFPPEIHDEVVNAFLPQRITDTLTIEGIRVNPRLTRAVLEGQSLSDADRYSELEILNTMKAIDLVSAEAGPEASLTTRLVYEIHRRLMLNLVEDAGAVRKGPVEITGASISPPAASDVPDLLRSLCDRYAAASTLNPIVRACWLHATFTAIHPFDDGNGRAGRLLQDFALAAGGLLPVGVPASQRSEYYEALERADHGEWDDIVQIVTGAELAALEKTIRIAGAHDERTRQVTAWLAESHEKVKRTEHHEYMVWRRQTEALVDELDRWVKEWNEEAREHRFSLFAYEPIPFERWREIRQRGWAKNVNLVRLELVRGRRRVLAFIFYARRHRPERVIDWEDVPDGQVGLFLTGGESGEDWERANFSDPFVRLREVLFCQGRVRAYRNIAHADTLVPEHVSLELSDDKKWVVEMEASIRDTVGELIGDVLRKGGLIS